MRAPGSKRRWSILAVAILAVLTVLGDRPAYAADEPSLVVVGMSGVSWDDVTSQSPALQSLATDGATANLVSRSVHTTACPADGWLAISAGSRAADTGARPGCRPLTTPVAADVPAWSDYTDAVAKQSYDAKLGLLGDAIVDGDISATAFGPGAAIAVASTDGQLVGTYAGPADDPGQLADALSQTLPVSDLTVIDVGGIRDDSAVPHKQQLAQVDTRLQAVLDTVRASVPEARILVVSIADAGSTPELQIAAMSGPHIPAGGSLTSASTRTGGLIQAVDLTPTILQRLGIDDGAALAGSPITYANDPTSSASSLTDAAAHASAVRPAVPVVYFALVILNLLLYAAAAVVIRTRAAPSTRPDWARRALRAASLGVAAIPVATYLANVAPWWRARESLLLYIAATTLIAGIGAILAMGGPWRRTPWGPPVAIAALTAALLCADVVGVLAVQYGAPMGISPIVGGRFYGFGNSSFVLWASALLVIAAAAAERIARERGPRVAAAVVAGIGLVAVVVDGWPALGADFGGPPALLPAFTVLALLVLGVRLKLRRIVVILAICAVAALSFAVIDWLRPVADRTHLGRFIETVLSGGLGEVLARKGSQNLSNLVSSNLTLLAIGGLLVLILVLARDVPSRNHANPPSQPQVIRPLLIALAICWGIAFVLNDSGVLLPAIGMSLAVPLLISMRLAPTQLASKPAAIDIIE